MPRAFYTLVADVSPAPQSRDHQQQQHQQQLLELEWSAGRVWEEKYAREALVRCLKGRQQGRAWLARLQVS